MLLKPNILYSIYKIDMRISEINRYKHRCSSVGFLDSSTGTGSTIFLRLASSRVGDQEGPVILEKGFWIMGAKYI